jgi:hypothetical protein
MRLLTRQKTRAEELRDAAVTGLLSVFEDQEHETSGKRGLTGVRAVAGGAAIYTAGFAAYKGRRFLRNQLSRDQAETEPRDEAATEAREQRDEPAAEGYYPGAHVEHEDEPDASNAEPERRAAREKAARPSLVLPRQRWTRMAVSRE